MKNNLFVILLTFAGMASISQAMIKSASIMDERTPNTGDTALIEATRAGNLATVQWLLANGADPELENYAGKAAYDEAKARRDSNPEVFAAIRNAIEKKNKEKFFAGYSPDEIALHDAVLYGRLNEARALLTKGVNPNIAPGAAKDSLLLIAADRANPVMVRLLLDAGADASYRNKNGNTALNRAEITEMAPDVKREIKQLLLDAQNKFLTKKKTEKFVEDFILTKAAGKESDYGVFENDFLNKMLTYIWPLLDSNNKKPLLDLATRLNITPAHAWNYLSSMKEEIIQALLAGQLYDLIRSKTARRAIDYGSTRYTLANLQALHAKIANMLNLNNQQPLLAAGQRLAITPYDMWNYLQAIKKDLETAISQRK